jgi:hypothetical protein
LVQVLTQPLQEGVQATHTPFSHVSPEAQHPSSSWLVQVLTQPLQEGVQATHAPFDSQSLPEGQAHVSAPQLSMQLVGDSQSQGVAWQSPVDVSQYTLSPQAQAPMLPQLSVQLVPPGQVHASLTQSPVVKSQYAPGSHAHEPTYPQLSSQLPVLQVHDAPTAEQPPLGMHVYPGRHPRARHPELGWQFPETQVKPLPQLVEVQAVFWQVPFEPQYWPLGHPVCRQVCLWQVLLGAQYWPLAQGVEWHPPELVVHLPVDLSQF